MGLGRFDLNNLDWPDFTTTDFVDDNARSRAPAAAEEVPRLFPRTGRTVHLTPGMDVGHAFTMLQREMSANKVPTQANAQRYHERAGMKRKRLRMVRWRRRFMGGFRATVKRVMELRGQGW